MGILLPPLYISGCSSHAVPMNPRCRWIRMLQILEWLWKEGHSGTRQLPEPAPLQVLWTILHHKCSWLLHAPTALILQDMLRISTSPQTICCMCMARLAARTTREASSSADTAGTEDNQEDRTKRWPWNRSRLGRGEACMYQARCARAEGKGHTL